MTNENLIKELTKSYVESEKILLNENDPYRYARAYGNLAGMVWSYLLRSGASHEQIKEAIREPLHSFEKQGE